MRNNPDVKGVFGTSWWFDPRVAEISPKLDFLYRLPSENGARFLFTGVNESATRDAISNSPEREALYVQGKYQPRSYMMLWARDDLLHWADTSLPANSNTAKESGT